MSIKLSQRRVSEIEYENTFYKVYTYITEKVRHLPKRHMHYIGEPVNRNLNSIYEKIMKCTDYYIHGKDISVDRYRACAEILKDMEDVIKLTYFWWNVSGENNEIKYVKLRQREFWSGLVNKEISLITGLARKCRKGKEEGFDIPVMHPYNLKQIEGVIFLEKLEKIQKVIYKRAIHLGKDYRDAQMEMLVKLSRDAFYNALEGNYTMATDEKQYNKRKRYFSEAIGNLYAMNRPFRELCFNNIFREKEMAELCNLVTECIKILKSIQNSDKERFEKLKNDDENNKTKTA